MEATAEHRDDGIEKCVAFGVRVRASRRGQIGQDIGEPGNQWEQRFDAAQPPQPTRTEAGNERTQGFRERLVGRTEVLVATAVEDDGALLVGVSGPFTGQARLAYAGFPRDQHCVRAAVERGLPRGQKSLEFAAAPDERPRPGQHRGQAGPLHGRVSCDGAGIVGGLQAELENMLRAREVAQLAHPEIGEDHVIGQ